MKSKEHGQGMGNTEVNRRMSVAVLLAATLVLVGGGCVSYSGCRTQEDRVRARYEQHFILSDDSSSTAFWKNTKHVFFDVVTCCFHEIWRGNARRTYRRMILAEQRRAQEEEEERQQEAERQARDQLERQRKAQAERERLERQRQQNEAEKALAKQREEERRKREEERLARDRARLLGELTRAARGMSSDTAIIRPQKPSETRSGERKTDR